MDTASLANLVETSRVVGSSRSRIAKIDALAAFLRTLAADEIGIAVAWLTGELPQGKIGIGYRSLTAAADVPAAAFATLSLQEVDAFFVRVAGQRGAGSSAQRTGILRELFARATGPEQDFLLRLIVGELRQGALAGIMVDAIAAASALPVAAVRRAAMLTGGLGPLAQAALTRGAAGLESFSLQLFAPVLPMLAQTAADVAEALVAFGADADFEWKMDGARIQVHKRGADVRIYTRALNEVGAAVPEVVARVRALPADELILDGEAIAFTEAGRPHAFQVTMRRFGRRLDVERMMAELPIRAFFFDCLLLDGRPLIDLPLRDRLLALGRAVPDELRFPQCVTGDADAAQRFYDEAIAAGHEGLMAKSLASVYEAGSRGASWFKIKRAHTLDLVVLAAEWGNGRRIGKLSNLHLGALDPATGRYVMLGKTFKGLTDAMLDWQTQALLERETHRDRNTVHVRPELVVEIAFSDLQASSRYPGGLALRLARVKRYRDDKSAADADTLDTVRRIAAAQG
ncbi:MAG TPA: ATP-dependent DNA ligase [Burkholderiaceae bacterium]|nr:ATP-dependent DNA ligase [Burkholderiaceae bacterium]